VKYPTGAKYHEVPHCLWNLMLAQVLDSTEQDACFIHYTVISSIYNKYLFSLERQPDKTLEAFKRRFRFLSYLYFLKEEVYCNIWVPYKIPVHFRKPCYFPQLKPATDITD
jgi:hypothetical protein